MSDEKCSFHSFGYKDGIIHTCYNRTQGKEEYRAQVSNVIQDCDSLPGAKRKVSEFLKDRAKLEGEFIGYVKTPAEIKYDDQMEGTAHEWGIIFKSKAGGTTLSGIRKFQHAVTLRYALGFFPRYVQDNFIAGQGFDAGHSH